MEIVRIHNISLSEVKTIIAIHRRILIDSYLNFFPDEFLCGLYQNLASNNHAIFLTASSDKRIIGYLVGFLGDSGWWKNFILTNPLLFIKAGLEILLTSPWWLLNNIFIILKGLNSETPKTKAELQFVAVDDGYQRRGIGKKMLKHFSLILKSQGIDNYIVGTKGRSLPANTFYQNLGFYLVKSMDIFGEPYNYYSTENPKDKQKAHFDAYALSCDQSYTQYEHQPFWKIVDDYVYSSWLPKIKPGDRVLDVGCGQGRSIKKIVGKNVNIEAFDISPEMIKQAKKRYTAKNCKATIHFFVGNAAEKLPFKDNYFDCVICYGVLHHLPNPKFTCQEIGRVLKIGGWYFGNENNMTIFRPVFDFIQHIIPAWHEEAGSEPTFSIKNLKKNFAVTKIIISATSIVFAPPQVINILGEKFGKVLFYFTEAFGEKLSWLKDNGGLIVVSGQKLNGSGRQNGEK